MIIIGKGSSSNPIVSLLTCVLENVGGKFIKLIPWKTDRNDRAMISGKIMNTFSIKILFLLETRFKP